MKTLKSILQKVPLHYRTGFLGGVIYILWHFIAVYYFSHMHYFGYNVFSYALLFIIFTPVYLAETIHGSLMSIAYNFSDQIPSFLQIIFLISSLVISDILFGGIGMIVGYRSENPEREELRRRIIIFLFAIVFIVGVCYAFFIAILAFLMRD